MCKVYCESCGAEYDSENPICVKCGSWTIRSLHSSPTARQTWRKNIKVILYTIGVGSIITLIGLTTL